MIGSWGVAPALLPKFWTDTKNIAYWFNALTDESTSTKTKGLRSLVILVCWSIWRERNAWIFDGKEKAINRVITEIKDEAALWTTAGAKHLASIVSVRSSE